MNICLIGDGLTNLTLAKILTDKKLKVSLYFKPSKRKLINTRTLGISKKNYDFFQKKIIKVAKLAWPINLIQIFTESNKNDEVLNFGNKEKNLFYLIENRKLYQKLKNNLRLKNNFKKIKIKNNLFYKNILKKNNFDLIINCEKNNLISKKFFYKKIIKNYKSTAFTSIIKHQWCINNKAIQIFTNIGPLAFLPKSNKETSIVYSVNDNNISERKIRSFIEKYNKNYKIKSFSKFEKFNLKFSVNRNYFYKNILNFGDSLHSIHPLAGQGFNMTLRDINFLSDIIENKLNLGLPIDSSIFEEFELKTKHLNYVFSFGVDFIYEFFKFTNEKKNTQKIFKIFNKNNLLKKYIIQLADKGI